jgi:hypothetical protein
MCFSSLYAHVAIFWLNRVYISSMTLLVRINHLYRSKYFRYWPTHANCCVAASSLGKSMLCWRQYIFVFCRDWKLTSKFFFQIFIPQRNAAKVKFHLKIYIAYVNHFKNTVNKTYLREMQFIVSVVTFFNLITL